MDERSYWLGFSALAGIGPAKFRKLLAEFGTAEKAWVAQKPEFSIENYVKKLKEKEVWFVTLLDKEYPKLLKEIRNPPFVLYGRGNKEILRPEKNRRAQDDNVKTIAVVGARKTTEYGREVTKLLTTELVLNGFTIASGLALGVDAIAHATTLENGRKTIAVLGCGVDCCNPAENQSIYNSIAEKGLIVSEFPLGMKPTQWTFPARNRIIAGLSQAVLVTEGAEDSGSLITANFALKFGRKVFAVPGPITSTMSKGPYKLIQKGATLVTSAEDIIKSITGITSTTGIKGRKSIKSIKGSSIKGGTKEEIVILKLLENESLQFDEIVRKTKFDSAKLGSLLSLMEIKGMVKSLDGSLFCLC